MIIIFTHDDNSILSDDIIHPSNMLGAINTTHAWYHPMQTIIEAKSVLQRSVSWIYHTIYWCLVLRFRWDIFFYLIIFVQNIIEELLIERVCARTILIVYHVILVGVRNLGNDWIILGLNVKSITHHVVVHVWSRTMSEVRSHWVLLHFVLKIWNRCRVMTSLIYLIHIIRLTKFLIGR